MHANFLSTVTIAGRMVSSFSAASAGGGEVSRQQRPLAASP